MQTLARSIAECRSRAEVTEASAALVPLQRRLMGAGVGGHQTGLLISDLVDALTRQLIMLAEEELGPPPGRYAWLACGSQGRGEQFAHTDQDNALIYADGLPEGADAWFAELSERVTQGLADCGIEHCPGGVGPDHVDWRGSASAWRTAIQQVIRVPETRRIMLASHYFDLRTVHGDPSLLGVIRGDALREAMGNRLFIARLKENAVRTRAGVGHLRRWRTPLLGALRGTLHLKQQGLLPVQQLAFVHAMEAGVDALNTTHRLRLAADAGILPPKRARDLERVRNTVLELRNRAILEHLDSGAVPTNRIRLSDLSRLERAHLQAALTLVRDLQNVLHRQLA